MSTWIPLSHHVIRRIPRELLAYWPAAFHPEALVPHSPDTEPSSHGHKTDFSLKAEGSLPENSELLQDRWMGRVATIFATASLASMLTISSERICMIIAAAAKENTLISLLRWYSWADAQHNTYPDCILATELPVASFPGAVSELVPHVYDTCTVIGGVWDPILRSPRYPPSQPPLWIAHHCHHCTHQHSPEVPTTAAFVQQVRQLLTAQITSVLHGAALRVTADSHTTTSPMGHRTS